MPPVGVVGVGVWTANMLMLRKSMPPVLSDKDMANPLLEDAENDFLISENEV